MQEFVPLRVTFRFSAPVAAESDYPIHLDDLLAAAAVRENERMLFDGEADDDPDYNPWDATPQMSGLLGVAEGADDWCWQASRLVFTPMSDRFLVSAIRRCDPEHYRLAMERTVTVGGEDLPLVKTRKTAINTRSGQQRGYQFFWSLQWMEKAEAWCVGDPDAIADLLRGLPAIGKIRRNGFGTIADVSVEPCAEAADRWRLRVLPDGIEGMAAAVYERARHNPRPPYWRKTTMKPLREPVTW